MTRVLGLDGGGTKTEAVLWNGHGVLGRGWGGPSNPNFVPVNAVDDAVAAAIAGALGDGRGHVGAVAAVVFGGPVSAAAVERMVGRLLPDTPLVRRCHEGDLVLRAGGVAGAGIAVVSGTGSMVMRRDSQGERVLVGGWGSLVGDEGSAYDIGRQALAACARAQDGRGPATELMPPVLAWAGVPTMRDAVRHVYDDRTTRAHIAQLARVVTQVAADGDAVARRILDDAGRELALQVAAALGQPADRMPGLWPLVGAGGVLEGSPLVRQSLQHHLADRPVEVLPPVMTLAEAAARIAADAAEAALSRE